MLIFFFKRCLEMKCSKIIASKVKLAQSVQDRTEQEQTHPAVPEPISALLPTL